MAECIRFVCSSCNYSIKAWSDGNSFYIDSNGKKKYAYHPDWNELALCIANDVPHLCLACGKEVKIDSRLESAHCPKCKSDKVVDCFQLDSIKCPKCDKGSFNRDESFDSIS